eukprot:Hpha_TRINITY_DN14041_c0_g1::TRINITY_DN14041_c0_g1_i2::g.43984::m.43984/K07359/CAMKK2; calcium/calmodulin-dependent protein kinase kinase 2
MGCGAGVPARDPPPDQECEVFTPAGPAPVPLQEQEPSPDAGDVADAVINIAGNGETNSLQQKSTDSFGEEQEREKVGRTLELFYDEPGHFAPAKALFELRTDELPKKVFITPTAIIDTDACGNQTVNEYTVLKDIGRGAYGKVSLVVSPSEDGTPKLFAMKTCKRNPGAPLTKEGMILLRMDHPHIVGLIEVIDDQDIHKLFLILEYLDGGSIMTLSDDGRTKQPELPEGEAAKFTLQIAWGLEELHSKNMVHRDIKPDNIFVKRDRSVVKIGDLGTALMFKDDNDTLKKTHGTLTFYSPEMCKESAYSGKAADVWAFGVTVYCFIYCEVPFNGSTAMEVFTHIQSADLKFHKRRSVSARLRMFLERMLTKTVLRRITLNEVMQHAWVTGGVGAREMEEVVVPYINEEDASEVPEPKDILFADDVYQVRMMISHLLRDILDLGRCKLETVTDGDEAISKCQYRRYKMVLLDVHMARVSGPEAAAAIREIERAHGWDPVPIVGLTADSCDEVSAQCLAQGMNRVLSKPVRISSMERLCRRYDIPVKRPTETNPDGKIALTSPVDAAKHAYAVAYANFVNEESLLSASARGPNVGKGSLREGEMPASSELSAEQDKAVQDEVAREFGLTRLPTEVRGAASDMLDRNSTRAICKAAKTSRVLAGHDDYTLSVAAIAGVVCVVLSCNAPETSNKDAVR